MLYWVFLVICFAVGVVFSLLRGTFANLGVSLIVGALFAGGALVGQVWGFAFQERQNLSDKAFGDQKTRNLENLGRKYWDLQRRIDHLQDELPGGRGGMHPEGQ